MATFHGNQNVGGVPSAIYREVGQHFTISVEFMVCVYYIYTVYMWNGAFHGGFVWILMNVNGITFYIYLGNFSNIPPT